jgi:hypothetical protein
MSPAIVRGCDPTKNRFLSGYTPSLLKPHGSKLRPSAGSEEKMATTKANITMIRNLKTIYLSKITEKYCTVENETAKTYRDIVGGHNKQIMKEIEDMIVARYPFLTKKLRCDYRASSYGTDEITVSVTVDIEKINSTLIRIAKEEMEQSKVIHAEALKRLEAWEEKAIRDAVSKSELPPFEI